MTGRFSLEISPALVFVRLAARFIERKRMQKDQKDSYSNDRRVLVAGFGSAAVLIILFFLLMSWLAEQVHLMQFCLSRFGH
jgi:hypothetical protein